MKGSQESLTTVVIKHGPPVPASNSSHGSRQELWPTITAHSPDMESSGPNGHSGTYLMGAVNAEEQKQWSTPQARDHKGSHAESFANPNKSNNLNDQMETLQTAGKLNPRWVETLMGLPIGWTMPSCMSPATIALTNCDSSEMELCQQQQSELFEY